MQCGLKACYPVDLSTGWDLRRRSDVRSLKSLLSKSRPLLTHFSPDCRIFCISFHGRTDTAEHADGLKLAVHCGELATFVTSLCFIVILDCPLASSIYKLPVYEKLRISWLYFVCAEASV